MADSHDRHVIELDAVDHAKEAIDSVKEHLMGIAETASAITLGQLGFEGIERTVDTIKELAKGLVEANAAAETLTQTFAAIYGSGAAAKQAVDWITQFALNAPFTRSSIMEAGVAIAAIGGNITEVLPALGNLASVMNVDMPTAAQALQDAFEGRFAMLQMDLNVTKQQLEGFGLQVSSTGQIVTSTLIPAFEKFVAAKYPDGMALQMKTFNGQMSNLEDQWQNIERIMGNGLFTVVKGDLSNLIGYIASHQAEVNAFAASIGEGIGHAADAAGQALRALLGIMPEIINGISMAWHVYRSVVETEAGVINAAVQYIGDFLRTTVAPAIYEALGTILLWWQQHGADVTKVLTDLWTNVKAFAQSVEPILADMFGAVRAVVEFAWGAIEVIMGTALQNIDGNTKRWQSMQLDGWTKMQAGVIDAVNSMMKGVLDLATGTALPDALLGIAQMLLNLVVGVFNLIPDGIGAALNAGEAVINQFMAKMSSFKLTIPGIPGISKDTDFKPFANAPQMTEDFLADAKAQGANAASALSTLLAPPAHTAKEIADAKAAQASRDKALDDAAQSLKDDMMRSSGYVQKAVGITNSASGDKPGTVIWVKAGTNTDALNYQYTNATAKQTGQDAVNAAIAAWTAALNKPGGFKGVDDSTLTHKSLTDLLGDTTGAQTSSQDAKAAADAAKQAAQKAEAQAREKFAWDIGHDASMSTLQEDIVSILGDMRKLDATHLDLATEQWNDGKQIDAHLQQLQSAVHSAASTKVSQDNEIFQNMLKETGITRAALAGQLRLILTDMGKTGATDADKQSAILAANMEITSYLDKGVQQAKDHYDKVLADAETRYGLDFKNGADTATVDRDKIALLAALRNDGLTGLQYQNKAFDVIQQAKDRLDAIDKTGKAAASAQAGFNLTEAQQQLRLDQINKARPDQLRGDVTAIIDMMAKAATKDHPFTALDRQVEIATYAQMLAPNTRKDPVSDLLVGFQNVVVQGNKDAAVQQLAVVLAAMSRQPGTYTANQIEAQRLSGQAAITAIQTKLDKQATTQESAEVKRARMVFATDMLLGHAGAAQADRAALLALMRKNHEESTQIGYDAADTQKQINALLASTDKKTTDAATQAAQTRLTRDQEQFSLALQHNNLPLAQSLSQRISQDMGSAKGADPYAIQLQQLSAQQQIAAATLRNENAQTSQAQKAADQLGYAFSTAMMKGDMGTAQRQLNAYISSLRGIDTPAQLTNLRTRDQKEIDDYIKNHAKLTSDAALAIKQSALDTAKERLANDVADKVKTPILMAEVAGIQALMKSIPGTTAENLRTERRHDLDLINGHVAALAQGSAPGLHGAGAFNPTAAASFGSTQVSLAALYTTSSNERMRQLEAQNATLRQELAARDKEISIGERQIALLQEVAEHGAQGNAHTSKIARAASAHPLSPSAALRNGGTTLNIP